MIDIPSHSSIEDRIDLARRMKEEMEMDSKVEMLVDNMEDHFNKDFAAWPIRYFIAKEGQLLHKSENRIENALFDQDTIQNFFKGLRPKSMKLSDSVSELDKQMRYYETLPKPQMLTMLHFSSIGNFPDHPWETNFSQSLMISKRAKKTFFFHLQSGWKFKCDTLWVCP